MTTTQKGVGEAGNVSSELPKNLGALNKIYCQIQKRGKEMHLSFAT